MSQDRMERTTRMLRSRILLFIITVFFAFGDGGFTAGFELPCNGTRIEAVKRHDAVGGSRAATPRRVEDGGQSFTFAGTTLPIEYDVYDERTERMERGLGYPALSPGRLTFPGAEDHDRWCDPTRLLRVRRGELIATIDDPDLTAELIAERGRLSPVRAEYESMLRMKAENPEAMSELMLVLKEGEAIQLEATVLEKEAK